MSDWDASHYHRVSEPQFDLTALAARDARPYTLDYWRLNISARKARG